MKQYTGKKIGSRYGQSESVIVYDAGLVIHIDRTARGREWCQDRGMKPEYTVTADGETFTVWAGLVRSVIGADMALACAIPV